MIGLRQKPKAKPAIIQSHKSSFKEKTSKLSLEVEEIEKQKTFASIVKLQNHEKIPTQQTPAQ